MPPVLNKLNNGRGEGEDQEEVDEATQTVRSGDPQEPQNQQDHE
jgi:hypothetical protein